MTDEMDDLLDGVTDASPESGAADAIVTPEMRERMRAEADRRPPPRAQRMPEPDATVRTAPPAPSADTTIRTPSATAKYRTYRKDELITLVERMEAELAELRATIDKLTRVAPDPQNNAAIRDLSVTIKLAAHMGFGIAAAFRGPHWNINKEEGDRVGDTGAIALAPYAAGMTDILPWLNFAAALAAPVAVRYAEDKRIQALKEAPTDNGAEN